MYKRALTECRYPSQGHCSGYHITHSRETGTVGSFTVKAATSFDSEESYLNVNPLEFKHVLGQKLAYSLLH